MDKQTFEQLLYEEESEALDFKSKQYRFVKASEDEKAELIKDILGFANAWRRSEAFILIGVDDVRGGRAKVVGIPASEQLDDHSLQQFVNSLTNRPIRFRYEAFTYDGMPVGVIRIAKQARPVHLKRKYGKLTPNTVYVRRGSSTDPTAPATPDEIASMGQASPSTDAELVVEFADVQRDNAIGADIVLEEELCDMPPADLIPDLSPQVTRVHGLAIDLSGFDPTNRPNRSFFRELAEYEFARRLFRPVRLITKNVGDVAAHNVRVELAMSSELDAVVIDESDVPEAPQRNWNVLSSVAMQDFRPFTGRDPGNVTIERNDERTRIEVDCGSLQPGRVVWSETFFVGKRTTGLIELHGRVFADNLPQPTEFMLNVNVTVTTQSVTVDDLVEIANSQDAD